MLHHLPESGLVFAAFVKPQAYWRAQYLVRCQCGNGGQLQHIALLTCHSGLPVVGFIPPVQLAPQLLQALPYRHNVLLLQRQQKRHQLIGTQLANNLLEFLNGRDGPHH